jgi:hypothetical protein
LASADAGYPKPSALSRTSVQAAAIQNFIVLGMGQPPVCPNHGLRAG